LDVDVFRSDLQALSPTQRFLRNGWNSDPSWDWAKALELAALIRESGRCTVFVTKCFRPLGPAILHGLVDVGAELRVSISAFDTDLQLRNRFDALLAFRATGGVAVAQVMTTVFADPRLNERQDDVVDAVMRHDLPGSENSIRVPTDLPVSQLLDRDQVGVVRGSDDLWAGRLYGSRLPVPTITSVPSEYTGLPRRHASALDREELESCRREPVWAHDEVMSGDRMDKPRQCGIARDWVHQ
jgi:hypothetical protein